MSLENLLPSFKGSWVGVTNLGNSPWRTKWFLSKTIHWLDEFLRGCNVTCKHHKWVKRKRIYWDWWLQCYRSWTCIVSFAITNVCNPCKIYNYIASQIQGNLICQTDCLGCWSFYTQDNACIHSFCRCL